MAERAKGITIPIEADVTGVKKAFKDLRSDSRGVENQLKDVNRALKFDPTNTTLLESKQKLLAQAVEKTGEQLTAAREAQEAFVNSGGDVDSSQYIQLQIETERLAEHMSFLENESASVADALNNASAATDKNAEETKKAEEAHKQAAESTGRWEVALGNLISNGLQKLISVCSNAINSVFSLSDDVATLANNYNLAQEAVYTLYQYQGLLDYSISGVTRMMKEQTENLVEGTDAYDKYGVVVRNAVGQLLSQDQIWINTIRRLREIKDPLERAAVGTELLGNKYYELGGILNASEEDFESFSRDLLSTNTALTKDIEGMNKWNDAVDRMKIMMTNLAISFGPIVGWFADLKGILPTMAVLIAGITAAWLAFGGAAKVAAAYQALLNAVMMANPIGLVILAVTALIAIMVLLWNNCEGFRQFWIDLWDTVLSVILKACDAIDLAIDATVNWIVNAFQSMYDWIVGLWNSLVSMFSGGLNVNVNANAYNGRARINGSHANGLEYVPFDGYIAELHKGERVLTASENANYSAGGGGVTIVQNIQSVPQSPVELAATAEMYFNLAKWNL